MEPFTPDQLVRTIQFHHPEKVLAGMPGIDDKVVAAILGTDVDMYRKIRAEFAERARKSASDLLNDPAFAVRVDRLPFAAGSTVVGLGDSITDDLQSWLEILRHLLALRRPQDNIKVVNAGVSGDTTCNVVSRFLAVTLEQPGWIICFIGTNDARLHGRSPNKVLVSIEETEKNLAMLRNFAATQTSARWVWITPAAVIEERNPDLLLPDGLHPSLAGQAAIVRELVEQLSG
jgi:acyl-CoA thioesterase-1